MPLSLLLLTLSTAMAGDIIPVPEGSSLTLTNSVVVPVGVQSYLLPELKYKSCLIAAQNLPVAEAGLTQCQAQATWALTQAREALEISKIQFDADENTVNELTTSVVQLGSDLDAANVKIKDLKSQRNTAWAITGGLVLGAVTVTAVAISP